MKDALTDLVALVGAALLVWAAFLVALPLGLGCTGAILLIAAAGLARNEAQ